MRAPEPSHHIGLAWLAALVIALSAGLLLLGHATRTPAGRAAEGRAEASGAAGDPAGGGASAAHPGRRADAGPAGSTASSGGTSGAAAAPLEEDDLQVLAMRRSFGDDAGMAADFTPYRHVGRATAAVGLDGVSPSARCDVRVLPVRSEGGFNCVVRVRCGDVTVYPDGALTAGYAPCDVERGVPTLATDRAPTERDGDPELLVDLDLHLVRVRDVRGERESLVEIRLD